MSEDKVVKIQCNLIARGTDGAEASVADNRNADDPDPAIGKQIIEKALQKEEEDDDNEGQ